jgi:hypothetical protein
MIRDIVFEQMYAKKVDAHVQQVAQQSFMSGRQQGWNDIMFILNELESKNIEPNQEVIVKYLQQMLQGSPSKETTENEADNGSKPQVKKTGLTLVK